MGPSDPEYVGAGAMSVPRQSSEATVALQRARGARPTWMAVDLGALTANYTELRAMVPGDTEVIPSCQG